MKLTITLGSVFNAIVKILIIFVECVYNFKTGFIFCKSIVMYYDFFFLYNKCASIRVKRNP